MVCSWRLICDRHAATRSLRSKINRPNSICSMPHHWLLDASPLVVTLLSDAAAKTKGQRSIRPKLNRDKYVTKVDIVTAVTIVLKSVASIERETVPIPATTVQRLWAAVAALTLCATLATAGSPPHASRTTSGRRRPPRDAEPLLLESARSPFR